MWKPYLLTAMTLNLVMAGCAAEMPQELSFDTIEQFNWPGEYSKHWKSQEPGLLVIASNEDLEEPRQFVTEEAVSALSQLDFTTHFAVIAFRGWQPRSHEGFHVERIVRQGDEVALYAQAGRPGGEAVVRSPYHLIKVRKEGKWGGVFTFKLYFGENEQAVASVSHRIP